MFGSDVRPAFLGVLCFITFISSVSSLWTQSERLWNPAIVAENTIEMFNKVRDALEGQSSDEEQKAMDAMFEAMTPQMTGGNIQIGAIILIIFDSIALYAAYLMWNLRKKGYFLYLLGMAVAFFAPLIFIGGWLGVITAFAGVFFSAIMSILYGINLKHMK